MERKRRGCTSGVASKNRADQQIIADLLWHFLNHDRCGQLRWSVAILKIGDFWPRWENENLPSLRMEANGRFRGDWLREGLSARRRRRRTDGRARRNAIRTAFPGEVPLRRTGR